MDVLSIREATIEDRDDVLAINDNVYEGVDYLKARYNDLLASPNTTAYVGIFDGKIVAFIIAFLVDDGRTIITRAGRSDIKYKGKGFYSLLKQHAIRLSGADENSFTAVNSNLSVSTESFRKKHNLVLAREMQRYIFNPVMITLDNGQQICTETPNIPDSDCMEMTHTSKVTETDLQFYMESENQKRYLFIRDVIIVDWVPYKLLPSNIPYITSPKQTNMLTNVQFVNGSVNGLLSVATIYESRDPSFTMILDIYGSDHGSLKHHLKEQIRFTRTIVDNTTSFLVFFDDSLSQDAVEKSFKEFDIERSIWTLSSNSDIEYSKQMLFTRSIK